MDEVVPRISQRPEFATPALLVPPKVVLPFRVTNFRACWGAVLVVVVLLTIAPKPLTPEPWTVICSLPRFWLLMSRVAPLEIVVPPTVLPSARAVAGLQKTCGDQRGAVIVIAAG